MIPGYEILEPLPSLGYGERFLARQTGLGRKVILKTFSGGRERAFSQFQAEATRMAGTPHPVLATIHDFGQHQNTFYFSMEAVEGMPLSRILEQEPDDVALPSGKEYHHFILEKMAEIADALEFIHLNGWVHRDLRPEILVLDRCRLPRIIDFSLARNGMDQSVGGAKKETSPYQSPELRDPGKGAVDFRSDIYSLGLILYQLLTFQLPGKIVRPVSKVNPDLPRDLDLVLARALEPNPANRYLRAEDLATDLRRVLQGIPVPGRPLGKSIRLFRRFKTHVAGLLMVAFLGGLAWNHSNQFLPEPGPADTTSPTFHKVDRFFRSFKETQFWVSFRKFLAQQPGNPNIWERRRLQIEFRKEFDRQFQNSPPMKYYEFPEDFLAED